MQVDGNKYYSRVLSRPLDLKQDGCLLEDWRSRHGEAHFARHPGGFLIFLSPDKLAACDEYAESDPYTVEENIEEDFHQRRINLSVELVREVIKDKGDSLKILDIGCGQGHITNRILAEFPGAEISGLDYSVSAIEYANEHYPGIDFIVADAYNPPYSKGYFDVVICNNLWEHVPDPLLLLGKISSVIRPGGYLILSTPSRYRLRNLVRVILGKPVTLISEHHVTEYSVGQVVEQLRYGGFEVVKICSRPIPLSGFKAELARKIFSAAIRLTGSHHQLEATVFYLARKRAEDDAAK